MDDWLDQFEAIAFLELEGTEPAKLAAFLTGAQQTDPATRQALFPRGHLVCVGYRPNGQKVWATRWRRSELDAAKTALLQRRIRENLAAKAADYT